MIFDKHPTNGQLRISIMNLITMLFMIGTAIASMFLMLDGVKASINKLNTASEVLGVKIEGYTVVNISEHASIKEDIAEIKLELKNIKK